MKNMKRWKRLLAVGMCSAMMFSMTVGVSATENQDTTETNVAETQEEEETAPEEEAVLKGDSGVSANKNDKLPQVDKEALEKAIENAVEPESTVEVTETEEDSDELPIVEWDNKFTVSSQDGTYGYKEYIIDLGENWKTESDYLALCSTRYINGVKNTYFSSGSLSERKIIKDSYDMRELAFESLSITYKFDRLLHCTNGVIDGVAKNVEITYVTEVESDYNIEEIAQGKPYALPTHLVYDGTQDLVFKLKDGIGDFAIKEIGWIAFKAEWTRSTTDFTYDSEAGELRVPYWVINELISDIGGWGDVASLSVILGDCIYQNGEDINEINAPYLPLGGYPTTWTVEYVTDKWSANDTKPKFIAKSYEFDGTQDMVFNFENGTGDNEIKAVKEVVFPIQEINATDENGMYLKHFRIGNYGTSFNYDAEKCQVTLYKYAVSAIVYGEWEAVSNVYGNPFMVVELVNGETRTVYTRRDETNLQDFEPSWTVKVLERSPEASSQHVVNLTESLNEFDADQMQNLIDINKNADVVLRTPEGVTFTFAKGTMRMIDDKDGYPFGVEIIADFSKSGIKNTNVESSVFACRINFEYSGELPGTAKISIPVDNKWNGQTLYYYQVMEDGTLKDTGKSGKVENGIFDVLQSHCSDYVLLAKSPKELGVTENTGGNDNNTGDNNNQTGNNNNTQGSGNNSNSQVKPADTTKTSPKTGDTNMILLFVVLCAGSCVVGVSALKARRRTR
ncbi:MAG: hypothetical protein HFH49_18455 [Lachnospiraceae bacterium]|nr:hypothetical protein [Lachnospiraceae bacterium]